MSGREEPGRSRIPDFASREEEAEFWDTHEFTDYLDESWPVKLEIAPDFHSVYRLSADVRLDDWRTVERLAAERGRDPKELAVEWLTERVRQEALAPAAVGS